MTELINGNVHAAHVRAKTKVRAEAFAVAHGRKPRLDVVIVGNHPASRAYVSTKTKMAHETAIEGRLIELPETIGKDARVALAG